MANIVKMLDLSTAHLSEEDNRVLMFGAQHEAECVLMENEFGYLVSTSKAFSKTRLESLRTCISYARSLGCSYIIFDRDTEIDPALPYHDW